MSKYEFKHSDFVEGEMTRIGYELLAMATRKDPQDPEQNQEAQDLCVAAHVMFSLYDIENAMEDLWKQMHS